MSTQEDLYQSMRAAVEAELQQAIWRNHPQDAGTLYHMLAYHMGWEGEGAGARAQGKRIRPLLVTLTCAASGGDWRAALPAAVAVELVHNFSLIHDDIEDNSPLRRGRPAVWKIWGIAQAINAGDALFTLAHLSIYRLRLFHSEHTVLEAGALLMETCLALTHGQHLDLSYQGQESLPVEAYWPMVTGKTAALLSACTELGAITAQAEPQTRQAYREFGQRLGLAFQAQDDLLGIWGDEQRTGKSSQSDLLEGKKSLPVLYGLSQGGPFANRWTAGPVEAAEVGELSRQLAEEGALDYTQEKVDRLTQEALQSLGRAGPQGPAGDALVDLTNRLLKRTH
jgi:geranylgeranyl diphosphate synthase type I